MHQSSSISGDIVHVNVEHLVRLGVRWALHHIDEKHVPDNIINIIILY